jgi:hypothetical protein
MTAKEFAKHLRDSGIEFIVDPDGWIRAKKVKDRMDEFCPITALYFYEKGIFHRTTDFYSAADGLGLAPDVAHCIVTQADKEHDQLEEFFSTLETGSCDQPTQS